MSAAIAVPARAITRFLWVPAGALARVQRVGYLALAAQLLAFMTWNTILSRRFALTWDYAAYHQAWYLIAHGDLNPYSSVEGAQFWRTDSEFLVWPLAPFYWLWPHDMILLWLEDAAVTVAELVVFTWLCEIVKTRCRERDAVWFAGIGLVLLLANPWVWWALSFDVHMEPFAVAFAALLAWDLSHGRRRAWAWVVPILIAGAPSASYLIGLGLNATLASRRTRITGVLISLIGIGYELLIPALHADVSVPLTSHFSYLVPGAGNSGLSLPALLAGVVTHPAPLLLALWGKRVDIIANLAPGGFLGLFYIPLLPLLLIVLLTNNLTRGIQFAEPLFQSIPLYVLLPVGTIGVLAWLARRHRRTAVVLGGVLAVQALGWSVVWGPSVPSQWLRVSPGASAVLAGVEARIPRSAEVIVSQGVVGPFSGRAHILRLMGAGRIPVIQGDNWFIVVPMEGIEIQHTGSATALIGQLAGPMHATLVTHQDGVWVFRWRPPPGVRSVTVPDGMTPLPAWAAPLGRGTPGRRVMGGPPAAWHMAAGHTSGYVADGIAWQEPPGRYQAAVKLWSAGPVTVEVWNDTGNVLLSRRYVPAAAKGDPVILPVDATRAYREAQYPGWGPFRAAFAIPLPGNRLEVRVWSPGGYDVNVYSARLSAADRATARAVRDSGYAH